MEGHVYEEGVVVGCCECVGVNEEEAGQQASIYNRSGQLFGLSLANSGQLFYLFLAINISRAGLRGVYVEDAARQTHCVSSA